ILLQGFSAELKRLSFWTLVCLLIGWITGYFAWVLGLGWGIYLGYMLYQMWRLNRWLVRKNDEPPPEAHGIWGDVFDNIYHLQRHQRQEKQDLQAVINRVQEITSALRDGIILLDWRGHLDFWNPAAQRLLVSTPKTRVYRSSILFVTRVSSATLRRVITANRWSCLPRAFPPSNCSFKLPVLERMNV